MRIASFRCTHSGSPVYRFYLSLRFLSHHWLMTLIGSFFVGASLVILVVVMSIMDGFQDKLKQTVRDSSADLVVTPRYPVDLARLEKVLLETLGPYAQSAAPYFSTITLVRKEGKIDRAIEEAYHVAAVCGVDGQKEQQLNGFGRFIENPALDRQDFLNAPFEVRDELEKLIGTKGVIVGRDLLREMGLNVGDRLRIFSIVPGEEDTDFDTRYRLFQVVGTYKSDNSDVDKRWVFMDHRVFQGFFDPSTSRPSVRVKLLDEEESRYEVGALLRKNRPRIVERSVAAGYRLRPGDGAFSIDSWRNENAVLVRAIESEKSMILMIAFLIVIAGASSIFAAQWLLVTDKIREIGILRALGAQVGGIVTIFVMNGFLMGVLGSVGGTLVGLLAVDNIDFLHTEVVSKIAGRPVFDPNIYLFANIPTKVDYDQVMQYALAALICTLFASAVPALRAGFMNPAKALHRD